MHELLGAQQEGSRSTPNLYNPSKGLIFSNRSHNSHRFAQGPVLILPYRVSVHLQHRLTPLP
jgi:hypothetical protein